MPISSDAVMRGSADTLQTMPLLGSTLQNPLYTAILITLIIMLVIIFVFNDVEHVWGLSFRVGVYTVLFTASLIFLNNKTLIKEEEKKYGSSAMDDIFSSGFQAAMGSEPTLTGASDNIQPVSFL